MNELFCDIDETLLHTFVWHSGKRPSEQPTSREPDASIQLLGLKHDIYLRPDLFLLKGTPFSLLTTGIQEYAKAVQDILAQRGFTTTAAYGSEDLTFADHDTGRILPRIFEGPCWLIDDNWSEPDGRMGSGLHTKLRKLPQGKHLQVQPYRHHWMPGGSKLLTIVTDHHPNARSLEDCLKAVREQ